MNSKLKNQLKKLRQENGYSQQQLADKLNISRQAISKWASVIKMRIYNVKHYTAAENP